MSKPEWGLKRICASCATRYYDMKKNPPICPNCKAPFDVEGLLRTRRGRATPKTAVAAAPEEIIDDLPVVEDGSEEEGVIEDAEELADEAVEEVVGVEE